ASSFARCAAAPAATARSRATSSARQPAAGTVTLGLELALELVEEPEIAPLRKDLLRRQLDHADLVEPQRVKAERRPGIECAPGPIGHVSDHLQGDGVVAFVTLVDHVARGALGLAGADIGRLDDGAQRAF